MSEHRLPAAENAEHLRPMDHTAQNRCFGCGPANSVGLHLKHFLADDDSVVCLAEIPDDFEGPKGFLHGGIGHRHDAGGELLPRPKVGVPCRPGEEGLAAALSR